MIYLIYHSTRDLDDDLSNVRILFYKKKKLNIVCCIWTDIDLIIYMLHVYFKNYIIFFFLQEKTKKKFYRHHYYLFFSFHACSRIILLGDLNYRISLSEIKTRTLVEQKEWNILLEKDQVIGSNTLQNSMHVFFFSEKQSLNSL